MDASLVTSVREETISRYGTPEIFNSDQGSRPSEATTPHEGGQYTGKEHTALLERHGIKISMNGKGRSIDNIAIERFFRTLKYEEVYVKEYESIKALRQGIECFIGFYNFNRLHSALNYDKPMNVYMPALQKEA